VHESREGGESLEVDREDKEGADGRSIGHQAGQSQEEGPV
jgi:hypothetical protein